MGRSKKVTEVRYPYRARLDDFLSVMEKSSVWSKGTFEDRARIMKKMGKTIEELYEAGLMTTQDPKYMEPADVYQFAAAEIRKGVGGLISRELMLLNKLCKANCNSAVEYAKEQFPDMKTKRRSTRLPPKDREFVNILLEHSRGVNDFLKLRGYIASLMSVGSGCRGIELQFAKVKNYNPVTGDLYLDVVKGQNWYGQPRFTVMIPEVRGEIIRYLELRQLHLEELQLESPYFFFNEYNGNHLSENMSYRFRKDIEKEIGIRFNFRDCRRTFMQNAVDDGIPQDTMSVIAGHRDRTTLDEFYAGVKQTTAVKELHKKWDGGRKD